jgi:hypothetical protein
LTSPLITFSFFPLLRLTQLYPKLEVVYRTYRSWGV